MEGQPLIGRAAEKEMLENAFKSRKSEFVILYGRRRVGKTFLVDQVFGDRYIFRMTAQANTSKQKQLLNFYAAFSVANPTETGAKLPATWFEAFQMLTKWASTDPRAKKVFFFDELPWLDGRGSDFLTALEHFWNSWAAIRSDVLLIGCGSAASWMMNKLIRNRGGLHNRVTERILLQPFTLAETEAFLLSKGAAFDRFQLLELYMAMGGIPFYLENVKPNRSVAQNIDRMFFSPSGILRTEYENLFRSLFNRPEKHTAVVEALAARSKGMLRAELLAKSGLAESGNTSAVLDELEQSGFIKRYFPFGKIRRDALYQLVDPYTLFYLSFIKDSKTEGEGSWLAQMDSPRWRAWSGYAFEFLCMSHVGAIKKQLGISGVYSEVSAWRSQKSEKGAQIDLLIDRSDRVISLCEIKFSAEPFAITKPYAENLANKIAVFRSETGTKKTIFLTMICASGLVENEHSRRWVNDSLDMSALFSA